MVQLQRQTKSNSAPMIYEPRNGPAALQNGAPVSEENGASGIEDNASKPEDKQLN